MSVPNSQGQMSVGDQVSLYLHQDNLMWNRLQTIGVIQIAGLGAAYSLGSQKTLCFLVVAFVVALTLLVFFLLKRDELIRDKIEKQIPGLDYGVGRKWFAPLKGREVSWAILALLLAGDIIFALTRIVS